MFVSNTATVAMMIPIANEVAKGIAVAQGKSINGHKTRNMLLMSIAYAANIGGTAMMTGSPPNLVVENVNILFLLCQTDLIEPSVSGIGRGSWIPFVVSIHSSHRCCQPDSGLHLAARSLSFVQDILLQRNLGSGSGEDGQIRL